MNIKRFALGGFKHLSDEELLVKASTVALALENNTYFSDPQPGLTALESVNADFQAKLAHARRKGSSEDTAHKNVSRKTLGNLLYELAFYVSKIANGDLPKLLSSGFTLSTIPSSSIVPDVIRGIVLHDGRQSGQMRLDFEKQKKVLLYEYRIGRQSEEGAEIQWEEVLNTTSSRANIIATLIPHTRYYMQVRAVNSIGKSDWSEPVSYVIR